jgi:hypothetical protein
LFSEWVQYEGEIAIEVEGYSWVRPILNFSLFVSAGRLGTALGVAKSMKGHPNCGSLDSREEYLYFLRREMLTRWQTGAGL